MPKSDVTSCTENFHCMLRWCFKQLLSVQNGLGDRCRNTSAMTLGPARQQRRQWPDRTMKEEATLNTMRVGYELL